MRRSRCGGKILALTAVALAALAAGCDDSKKTMNTDGTFVPAAGEEAHTILLYSFAGANHVREAKSFKLKAAKYTQWTDLFVIHEADRSALYWGKYPNTKAAQTNLRRAKNYRTPAKVPVFAKALVVMLPGSEVGPRQWNLAYVDGAYTVAIAVFYDVPKDNYFGRKKYAVMYCRQLRQQGKEAYFRHGPARSTVTIGAFPESAIQMVRKGPKTVPVIRDSKINAILAKYPDMAVNGRRRKVYLPKIPDPGKVARDRKIRNKRGKAEEVVIPSALVRIPAKKFGP